MSDLLPITNAPKADTATAAQLAGKKPVSPAVEVPANYADWFPAGEISQGTAENRLFLERWKANPMMGKEYQRFEYALQAEKKYQKESSEFVKRQMEETKMRRSMDAFGAVPDMTAFPKRSNYGAWVSTFGATSDEVATNVAAAQDRAGHITRRILESGFFEKLKADKQLANDFEDVRNSKSGTPVISDWLFYNGLIKTQEEKDLFDRHANNPYSKKWGISVYQNLYQDWISQNPERGWQASNLPMEIIRGRKLNANNKQDVADFQRYVEWRKSQEGHNFFVNFFTGAGHLIDSFGMSIAEAARSTVYPEFNWTDEWKIASGENAELKEKFIKKFDEWSKDPKRNKQSGSSQLASFERGEKSAMQTPEDWDFPDPLEAKPIDEQTRELLEIYRQLDAKGAFQMDVWGFSALFAGLDATVQGTLAISSLGFSTDPDSVAWWAGTKWSQAIIDSQSMVNGQGVDGKNAAKYGLTAYNPLFSFFIDQNVSTRAQMAYFENSVNVQNWFMDKSNEGLIFTGKWYDSRVGYNTSMWSDVFLVAAPLSKGLGALRATKAQAAVRAGFEGIFESASAEHRGLLANMEYLVRKKMGLGATAKRYIDIAIDEIKARTGKAKVTETEALEAILKGEALFESPVAKGQKVALTKSEIELVKNDIVNHANNVWHVRRELANTAAGAREWYANLSDTSKATMKKIRDRLVELEPNGGWDKANDSVIYLRSRTAPIEKPGTKSAISLTATEIADLNKEVGKHWSGINVTGKAGFRAADSLGMSPFDPNLYYYGAAGSGSFILEYMAKGLGWVSNKVVKWLGAHLVNPSEVQTVLRTTSTSNHELASTRLGVGSQTALERVSTVNKWIQAANVAGDFEAAFASLKDYFFSARKAPVDATGNIHNLKRTYLTRIDEIERALEANVNAGAKLKDTEIAALKNELGLLTKKVKFVSRVDALSRYGVFDMASQIKGYGGSLVVGEGLMMMNDTESFGLGSGFVTGMRGGHILSGSIFRNTSPTATVKERANLSLYSLSMKMRTMAPDQGAILMEAIARLYDRKEKAKLEPGRGVLTLSPESRADIEFQMGLSILDRLYSIHGDVILTKGSGLIDGVAMLQSAIEYRTNPELRQQFIDKLQEAAGRLGLTGDEARNYAMSIMDSHEKFLTARQRIVHINEESEKLEGEKVKISEKVGKRLQEVKEALDLIVREAGLNPELLSVRYSQKFVKPEDGKPRTFDLRSDNPIRQEFADAEGRTDIVEIRYQGQNLSQLPGIDPKVISRLQAVLEEKRSINQAIQVENNNIVEINNRIRELGEERSTLMAVPETPGYSDRQIAVNPDGSYVINRKGLTIWEVPSVDPVTGKEVTRARVYIDIEEFLKRAEFTKDGKFVSAHGYQIALEEYAHALYFGEAMRPTRIQMERDILGGWSVDENGTQVMKVLDSKGNLVDAKPGLTGDVNQNLEIIREYALAYANSLPSEAAKAEFMARFDYGVKKFGENKFDTRHLQGVFMELWSSMYVQRNMMNMAPQAKSRFGSAESYTGNWNTSPIMGSPVVAGGEGARNWLKFVFGETTLVDILMKGRYDLMSIDPNSPEAAQASKYLQSVMNVVNYFGPNGLLPNSWNNVIHDRLTTLGVLRKGNDSNDPFRYWNMDEMWGPDGSLRQIPFEAKGWVDAGILHSRGLGSRISFDDPFNVQRVIKGQDALDPEETRFRVTWAYATGRQHWLSARNDPIRVGTPGQNKAAGVFKKKVEELFFMENRVIRDFVGMVVKDDPNGEGFGLQVRKSGNYYTLVGQPNPEQAAKVFEWIKEQNRIVSDEDVLFRMNGQTLNIVKEMLSSLSNSSFHKDASNPGYNVVYRGEYQGVTRGVGAGTTASVKADGPRDMLFSPLMLVIKDTQLTAEGTKIYEGTNKEGQKVYMSRPMLYVLAMDHQARSARVAASWQGRLSDKNGKIYGWTNDEMVSLFGSFNNFTTQYLKVMQNYATAKYGTAVTDKPEFRTWEVLMEAAGNDKKKALKMAAIIHRTIGTFEDAFTEATKAERDALLTSSERRRKALLEFAEQRRSELDFEPDARKEWIASLIGKDRAEYGAGPMSDTRQSFFLFRPDRFIGEPVRVTESKGKDLDFPISGASYGFMQIGYGTQSLWGRANIDKVNQIRGSFEWGSSRLNEVWEHPSGYLVWSVMPRKGGKFQPARFTLIAPDGSVVERKIGDKIWRDFDTKEGAFELAGQHSKQNRQSNVPIVGNEIEQAMKEAGWLPRGIDFKVNARSEFSSIDDRWFVKRNQRGGWDLYENSTGLMVMDNIRIYGQKRDRQGRGVIDPNELAASVKLAEESGVRQVAIDYDFIQKHAPSIVSSENVAKGVNPTGMLTSAYMEWVPNQGKTSPLMKRRFAENNTFYWEFKRTLAQSTSPAFAIEATRRMVEALGEDVVENDKDGTVTRKWAADFVDRLEREGLFATLIDTRSFDQIKADEHLETKRERARAIREGLAVDDPKSVPTKPKNKPVKPIPEAYDTVEAYNAALLEFDNLSREYDRQLGDWEFWKDAMTEWEQAKLADELRQNSIGILRELVRRDIKKVEAWKTPEVGGTTPEATAALDAVARFIRTENALKESQQAIASDFWVNKSGYLIQKMMYNEPKFGPGINIRFKDKKPLSMEQGQRVNFWLFTQQGQLVGKFDKFEDAQNGVFLDMAGKANAEGLKSLRNPNDRKATK